MASIVDEIRNDREKGAKLLENEFSKSIDFYEVKRDAARIDLKALERKAQSFFEKNPERLSYRIAFKGLSIKDM